jgi:hypothetical protein
MATAQKIEGSPRFITGVCVAGAGLCKERQTLVLFAHVNRASLDRRCLDLYAARLGKTLDKDFDLICTRREQSCDEQGKHTEVVPELHHLHSCAVCLKQSSL